ncbi:MAG: hypothetical protein R3247_06210 [Rhodothermales bacterium]|nr:hypothetical protein [Rhodothermales bacterium]
MATPEAPLRKHLILGALLSGAALLFAAAATAQAPAVPTLYAVVEYLAVPPGGGAEYEATEREIWKAIHEERLQRGIITGWALYDVWMPALNSPYDYVTVSFVDDFGKLADVYSDDLFAAAHPGGDHDAMRARTEAAREMVHSEVWQLQSTATAGMPGDWVLVSYMQVPAGGDGEYMAVENEIWKPAIEARIQEGGLRNWSVYSLVMPYGADMRYNYATTDTFESLADVAAPWFETFFPQAHAGLTPQQFDAMMARTDASRTILKGELWHLLDAVNPETTGSQ